MSPVYFCASKLEAFRDRGKEDCQSSRDLEDVISAIDGREELVDHAVEGPVPWYGSGHFMVHLWSNKPS
jgi:hypothetical protein